MADNLTGQINTASRTIGVEWAIFDSSTTPATKVSGGASKSVADATAAATKELAAERARRAVTAGWTVVAS